MRTAIKEWFLTHVLFISWSTHWKGVYVHFIPGKCHRFYFDKTGFHHDWHSTKWAPSPLSPFDTTQQSED